MYIYRYISIYLFRALYSTVHPLNSHTYKLTLLKLAAKAAASISLQLRSNIALPSLGSFRYESHSGVTRFGFKIRKC